MKAIFVAGTDTGVGKTVITGLLGRYLLEKGYRVATQKWIQTGSKKYRNDIDIHLKLMGKERSDYSGYLSSMLPYEFKLAASPHLAARLENRRISESVIKKSLARLSKDFDFVIIEGIGGLLVPIGPKKLLIDVLKDLRLPVLLVAGNRLGAINSTLLSIEALRSRKMNIAGVVFNNISKNDNKMILEDNPKIVKRISGIKMIGILPFARSSKELYDNFTTIGIGLKDIMKRI